MDAQFVQAGAQLAAFEVSLDALLGGITTHLVGIGHQLAGLDSALAALMSGLPDPSKPGQAGVLPSAGTPASGRLIRKVVPVLPVLTTLIEPR